MAIAAAEGAPPKVAFTLKSNSSRFSLNILPSTSATREIRHRDHGAKAKEHRHFRDYEHEVRLEADDEKEKVEQIHANFLGLGFFHALVKKRGDRNCEEGDRHVTVCDDRL
jgi:hypothetical protein